MPQELLALRYFQSRDIDRCIRQPEDLLMLCRHWLEHPEKYRQLKNLIQSNQLIGDRNAIRKILFSCSQGSK